MSQPRRILTPGISRKRKEREPFYSFKPSIPVQSSVFTNQKSPPPSPNCSNRVLAGYMAHEFLTKGTLLGQKFEPAQAELVPVTGPLADSREVRADTEPKEGSRSYAEVASILKDGGAHIPGIVNPAQLARWVRM
ncbi:hypothetical protein V6N13_065172 [Hibiscus sabdariffa]|uniref:Embryo sac development arrest 6 n=1 Tax=Hibiscus sabdariffa TaxID=183260 RepID=A0ABR2QRM0_9ROSI